MLIWITLAVFLIINFRALILELSFLPSTGLNIRNHFLMGKKVSQYLKNHDNLVGRSIVIISPDCPPCLSLLKELVLSKKRKESLIVLVDSSNSKSYLEILNKYSNLLLIDGVSKFELEKINVRQFPAFLKVNETGVVQYVSIGK